MGDRKSVLLRLDPAVHEALTRWAADEMRSTNAQLEFLLRRALHDAGRLPRGTPHPRRPGRPKAARPGSAAESPLAEGPDVGPSEAGDPASGSAEPPTP
jgi:hypothetical protein